jgi:DNA ligase D-like protein (predicted 3'-phosphoesterase)
LHDDLWLEVNDSLKSWTVHKGSSTDPRDKRLAIPTEDHALAYADFEGVIPKGTYRAGTVLVWDKRTYRNLNRHNGLEVSMEDALASGHVKIWLDGQKLKGGYT